MKLELQELLVLPLQLLLPLYPLPFLLLPLPQRLLPLELPLKLLPLPLALQPETLLSFLLLPLADVLKVELVLLQALKLTRSWGSWWTSSREPDEFHHPTGGLLLLLRKRWEGLIVPRCVLHLSEEVIAVDLWRK